MPTLPKNLLWYVKNIQIQITKGPWKLEEAIFFIEIECMFDNPSGIGDPVPQIWMNYF